MKKVSIDSKKVFLRKRIDHDRNLRVSIDNSMVTVIDRAFESHPLITNLPERTDFREMMMRFEILPD